jgi:hypothetical protein
MKSVVGCRSVKVLAGVTSGTLGGQYILSEVTNAGASDVLFYPNDFPNQGHPANGVPDQGIPIKAGETRVIPMIIYNFTTTGKVTVVAYGQ